jgi:hypothetical protein
MVHDFGSSENLLKDLQEKSDDLERVVICPPGWVLTENGRQKSAPEADFFMVLHFLRV